MDLYKCHVIAEEMGDQWSKTLFSTRRPGPTDTAAGGSLDRRDPTLKQVESCANCRRGLWQETRRTLDTVFYHPSLRNYQ